MNEEHFTFHLQYKHSGTFANRKYEELSYPKNPKMCDPILECDPIIVNPVVKIRPHLAAHTHYSLVILKLDLELIATESPFAPNNYLSDPNQHIKSLPKSTRRKNVNLPEHFQLICIISKGLLVCVFWNVKKAQLKINVMK